MTTPQRTWEESRDAWWDGDLGGRSPAHLVAFDDNSGTQITSPGQEEIPYRLRVHDHPTPPRRQFAAPGSAIRADPAASRIGTDYGDDYYAAHAERSEIDERLAARVDASLVHDGAPGEDTFSRNRAAIIGAGQDADGPAANRDAGFGGGYHDPPQPASLPTMLLHAEDRRRRDTAALQRELDRANQRGKESDDSLADTRKELARMRRIACGRDKELAHLRRLCESLSRERDEERSKAKGERARAEKLQAVVVTGRRAARARPESMARSAAERGGPQQHPPRGGRGNHHGRDAGKGGRRYAIGTAAHDGGSRENDVRNGDAHGGGGGGGGGGDSSVKHTVDALRAQVEILEGALELRAGELGLKKAGSSAGGAALLKRISELEKERSSLAVEVAQGAGDLRQAREEADSLKDLVTSLHAEREADREMVEDREQRCAAMESECGELRALTDALRVECDVLLKRVDAEVARSAALERAAGEADAENDARGAAQVEEVRGLEERLAEARSERDAARRELASVASGSQDAIRALAEERRGHDATRAALLRERARVAEMGRDADAARSSRSRLCTELGSSRGRSARLEAEVAELRAALEESERGRANAETRAARLAEERASRERTGTLAHPSGPGAAGSNPAGSTTAEIVALRASKDRLERTLLTRIASMREEVEQEAGVKRGLEDRIAVLEAENTSLRRGAGGGEGGGRGGGGGSVAAAGADLLQQTQTPGRGAAEGLASTRRMQRKVAHHHSAAGNTTTASGARSPSHHRQPQHRPTELRSPSAHAHTQDPSDSSSGSNTHEKSRAADADAAAAEAARKARADAMAMRNDEPVGGGMSLLELAEDGMFVTAGAMVEDEDLELI